MLSCACTHAHKRTTTASPPISLLSRSMTASTACSSRVIVAAVHIMITLMTLMIVVVTIMVIVKVRADNTVVGMRASCRHGGSSTPRRWGWGVGWGGGGVIACGSVESYGIYSVFYTCGLLLRVGLPCVPLLECVYLHRFLRVKKRTTRYLRCFCLFSEGIFSGQVQSYGFYIIIYT